MKQNVAGYILFQGKYNFYRASFIILAFELKHKDSLKTLTRYGKFNLPLN